MKLKNLLTGSQVLAIAAATMTAPNVMASSMYATNGDGAIAERLPFKITVDVRNGYDSNPLTRSGETLRFADTGEIARNPQTGAPLLIDEVEESWFSSASILLEKALGGPRTSLNVNFTAGVTQYWDLDQDETDPLLRLGLEFSHKVTPRLDVAANTYLTYQSEPDFYDQLTALTNGRRNGNYFYSNSVLSASYRWTPKFSTVTSYSFVSVIYEEDSAANIEDRYENYLSQQFRYLILPKTTLLAEYRVGFVSYDTDNGRDAFDQFILGGVEHRLGPKLSASISSGVQLRDEDGGANRTSPYVEGTLSYAYSPMSSLSAFTRYGLENSSLVDSTTENETFRIGLRVNHGFTAKLKGNAAVYFQNTEFSGAAPGVDRSEQTVNASAGLTYFVTPHIYLNADYSFSMVDSDRDFNSYDRNRVSLGVGAQF